MDEISATMISKALDCLSVRYQFTAQNIANANTPDYQPVRVTFENSLKEASSRGLRAIEAVKPSTVVDSSTSGSVETRLDLELASASQTAARYRALLDILGRQMALHRAVVGQGGR